MKKNFKNPYLWNKKAGEAIYRLRIIGKGY